MSGAARANQDTAGGTIIQGSSNVITNGNPQVRIGDAVQPHGKGPHSAPKMSQGSSTVLVNGIGASRAGDSATCGHPATGSGTVFIG